MHTALVCTCVIENKRKREIVWFYLNIVLRRVTRLNEITYAYKPTRARKLDTDSGTTSRGLTRGVHRVKTVSTISPQRQSTSPGSGTVSG